MNSRQLLISCLVFGALFALPLDLLAGEVTLTPSVSAAGRYDNNLFLDRVDPIEDYSSIIRPVLDLNYKTELTDLNLGGDLRFVNYLDQTDLDTLKQKYYFDAVSRWTERLLADVKLNYIFDTLLDSELEETGRVFNFEDRERIRAGGGMKYQLSQKSNFGGSYYFRRTDYREENRSDRNRHDIKFDFNRFFNNGLDKLTIRPGYSYILVHDDTSDNESEGFEVNSYSLNLGWTHKSSELGTIRVFAGGRYTEETTVDTTVDEGSNTDDDKSDTFGFVIDCSYDIKDEISSFRIGYRRDIDYDANNDLREVDRLYTDYEHSITIRLYAGVAANFYMTRSERTDSGQDTRFLDIKPKLGYKLTENHEVNLLYRYSLDYDESEEDETVDRSQILLAVVLRFPKKF